MKKRTKKNKSKLDNGYLAIVKILQTQQKTQLEMLELFCSTALDITKMITETDLEYKLKKLEAEMKEKNESSKTSHIGKSVENVQNLSKEALAAKSRNAAFRNFKGSFKGQDSTWNYGEFFGKGSKKDK